MRWGESASKCLGLDDLFGQLTRKHKCFRAEQGTRGSSRPLNPSSSSQPELSLIPAPMKQSRELALLPKKSGGSRVEVEQSSGLVSNEYQPSLSEGKKIILLGRVNRPLYFTGQRQIESWIPCMIISSPPNLDCIRPNEIYIIIFEVCFDRVQELDATGLAWREARNFLRTSVFFAKHGPLGRPRSS